MIFLQTINAESGEYLLQFGVLGIFAILLLGTVYYLEKQRTKYDLESKAEKNELRDRVLKNEIKLDEVRDEISKKLESIIIENSKVLARNADIMEEVKYILQRLSK